MDSTEHRSEALKIANQARALLDTITNENRSEKEAEFERMMSDSDAHKRSADMLDRAEERSREFETIATKIAASPITVEGRSGDNEIEARANAIADYLRADVSEAELRALGVGTPAGGGYTVPNDQMTALVETQKAFGPMLDASLFNVFTTAGGNVIPVPTNDETDKSAAQTAEGAAYNELDPVFGQKSLGAYKHTSMFKVSEELLSDAGFPIIDYVYRALGTRIYRKVNAVLTSGTGTNQSQGIVTGAGVGLTSAASNALAADELIKLRYKVDVAYRGNAAYMFNDNTACAIRLLKDTTGKYLWEPSVQLGQPDRFDNHRVVINNNMDDIAAGKRAVIFGDFKHYMVRLVGGVEIKRLNERYADTGQVGFLIGLRADGLVDDSAAIKALVQAAS